MNFTLFQYFQCYWRTESKGSEGIRVFPRFQRFVSLNSLIFEAKVLSITCRSLYQLQLWLKLRTSWCLVLRNFIEEGTAFLCTFELQLQLLRSSFLLSARTKLRRRRAIHDLSSSAARFLLSTDSPQHHKPLHCINQQSNQQPCQAHSSHLVRAHR